MGASVESQLIAELEAALEGCNNYVHMSPAEFTALATASKEHVWYAMAPLSSSGDLVLPMKDLAGNCKFLQLQFKNLQNSLSDSQIDDEIQKTRRVPNSLLYIVCRGEDQNGREYEAKQGQCAANLSRKSEKISERDSKDWHPIKVRICNLDELQLGDFKKALEAPEV